MAVTDESEVNDDENLRPKTDNTYQRMMKSSKRLFGSSSTQAAAQKPDEPLDSPVRSRIKKGTVAAIKGAFDRLAKDEHEAEKNIKRLRKPCPKPITPDRCSSKKKKGSRVARNQGSLSLNQALIVDYLRKAGGDEKESESS